MQVHPFKEQLTLNTQEYSDSFRMEYGKLYILKCPRLVVEPPFLNKVKMFPHWSRWSEA